MRSVIESVWRAYVCRISGTIGAVLTCPLEVVKTRLQVEILMERASFPTLLITVHVLRSHPSLRVSQ